MSMNLPEGLVDDEVMLSRLMRLVDCLCSELAAAGGPDLCFCGPMIGEAPPPFGMLDCGRGDGCGIAWVRPMEIFTSTNFPQPDENPTGSAACSGGLVMAVEVGVARCAPGIPTGKSTHDLQDMVDATRLYLSDQRAIRRAIACCYPKVAHGEERRLSQPGTWNPLPVAGRASGGFWTGWIG